MTKPMHSNEEYERFEKFHNRVSILNDVLDDIIDSIVVLGITFVICFVVLKVEGAI